MPRPIWIEVMGELRKGDPLSPRALQALEILKAGGRFRQAPEFRGKPRFRLLTATGEPVAGMGLQTLLELSPLLTEKQGGLNSITYYLLKGQTP